MEKIYGNLVHFSKYFISNILSKSNILDKLAGKLKKWWKNKSIEFDSNHCLCIGNLVAVLLNQKFKLPLLFLEFWEFIVGKSSTNYYEKRMISIATILSSYIITCCTHYDR